MGSQVKDLVIKAEDRELEGFIVSNHGSARNKLLDQFDRILIQSCIDIYGNNQTKIAQVLGLNRGTLRKRMSRVGLVREGTE